jgi:alpha-beta hydrolase superfamily lysophospholipase
VVVRAAPPAAAPGRRRRQRQLSVFALVHGAWHGGWSWERLAPELEHAGHQVVAPDLPCDDPAAGLDAYTRVIADALDGAGEDVVLVGHSLAGLTVPLVAAARPVRRLVLVAALLPEPGLSLVDQVRAGRTMLLASPGRSPDPDRSSFWTDEAAATAALYGECDPRDAHGAYARLRKQALTPQAEPSPLTDWPAVPTEYIVCTHDQMVSPDYGARAAAARGIPVRALASDHSPMLSHPEELSALLQGAHAEAA